MSCYSDAMHVCPRNPEWQVLQSTVLHDQDTNADLVAKCKSNLLGEREPINDASTFLDQALSMRAGDDITGRLTGGSRQLVYLAEI